MTALSTVALVAYNLLVRDGKQTALELSSHTIIVNQFPSDIPVEQITQALQTLVERGYITSSGGSFDVVDQLRRLVTKRSTGEDGWAEWQVQGHSGRTLLDEVIS